MANQQSMKLLLNRTLKKMGLPMSKIRTGMVGGYLTGGRGRFLIPSWKPFETQTVTFSSLSRSSFQKRINSFDLINDNRYSLGFSDKFFGNYDKVTPFEVSSKAEIPEKLTCPDYCFSPTGAPLKRSSKNPVIMKPEDIIRMREPCQLARYVLDLVIKELKPGVTTDDLDRYAHSIITKNAAYPSALGYKKFPKSICTSVNNVACHGIPDSRKLIAGDIVSVDVMAYKNGFHGDCAATAPVGLVDPIGIGLIEAAEACMEAGISQCGPGKPISAIGKAIEECASSYKVNILHSFTGHGVGRNIHEKPDIFHYYRKEQDKEIMKPGMVFTVEPIVTQGMDVVMVLSDGWTSVTVDDARTAQFEHTVHITETGFEIMTSKGGSIFYDYAFVKS